MSVDQTTITAILAIVGKEGQALFEKQAWANRDTDIAYEGQKIVLPADPSPMGLEIAIETLQRKLKDENTVLDVIEKIPGYPFDAAVAFIKAMQRAYGWAQPVPTPGFFGGRNPNLMTVKTGPKPEDTIQVPIGSFKVPGIENDILVHLDGESHDGRMGLCIHGNVRKREKRVIMDLIADAKKIMKKESIYKGKALRLHVDDKGDLIKSMEPTFIETDDVLSEELIFSRSVQDQIDTSLLTPIRHTAKCEKHGIPLRRGILLEGPYGCGKSMTARITSQVCVENGWTFIMLDKVQGLKAALEFARNYQPAVVFAEDIDRIAEERDEEENDLLNTIDGILSKDAKVITVLTTNFVENIEQAMLRPGRLDAVISVSPPDSEAAQRLVRLYSRGLLAGDEPLDRLGEELQGQIPATIREVCERSKLAMVNGGRNRIIEDDLIIAAQGMKKHLDLLNAPRDEELSAGERLGNALSEIITGVEPVDLSGIEQKITHAGKNAEAAAAFAKRAADAKPNGGMTKDQAKMLTAVHNTVVGPFNS